MGAAVEDAGHPAVEHVPVEADGAAGGQEAHPLAEVSDHVVACGQGGGEHVGGARLRAFGEQPVGPVHALDEFGRFAFPVDGRVEPVVHRLQVGAGGDHADLEDGILARVEARGLRVHPQEADRLVIIVVCAHAPGMRHAFHGSGFHGRMRAGGSGMGVAESGSGRGSAGPAGNRFMSSTSMVTPSVAAMARILP